MRVTNLQGDASIPGGQHVESHPRHSNHILSRNCADYYLPGVKFMSHKYMLYIIGGRVQAPTVKQGQK
jgi:hypothetical protein